MSGIIRAPRPERGWTELANTTLRDRRLSYRARGVLARLLSNAEGFSMTALDLADESPAEGRQAVLTALAELRKAGFILQRRLQGERGRWYTETFVYDTPQLTSTEVRSPDSGQPDVGRPDAGQPDRKEKEQKKKQNKEQEKPQRERAEGQGPSGRRAKGPLSGGGVSSGKYLTDEETKISLQVGNAADLQAMSEIRNYPRLEIEAAVARARAGEPSGRAYPSAVLRILRRGGQAATAAPAWVRAGALARSITGGGCQQPQPQEIDITEEGETL